MIRTINEEELVHTQNTYLPAWYGKMYVSVRLCINYIITITKWLSRSAWQRTEEVVVVNQCNLGHQTSMTECLLHLKESLWIDVLDLYHADVKSLFKTASQKKPKYFCPLYRQKWVFSAPGWATFTTGREVRERKTEILQNSETLGLLLTLSPKD